MLRCRKYGHFTGGNSSVPITLLVIVFRLVLEKYTLSLFILVAMSFADGAGVSVSSIAICIISIAFVRLFFISIVARR